MFVNQCMEITIGSNVRARDEESLLLEGDTSVFRSGNANRQTLWTFKVVKV